MREFRDIQWLEHPKDFCCNKDKVWVCAWNPLKMMILASFFSSENENQTGCSIPFWPHSSANRTLTMLHNFVYISVLVCLYSKAIGRQIIRSFERQLAGIWWSLVCLQMFCRSLSLSLFFFLFDGPSFSKCLSAVDPRHWAYNVELWIG